MPNAGSHGGGKRWRRDSWIPRVETAPSSSATLDAPRVAACLRGLAERDRLVVVLTFYARP